jgi:hypothetical protein
MSAAAMEHEDPLDPGRILLELPERERAGFLAAYRKAIDAARDPSGWDDLRKTLLTWHRIAIAAARPGFREEHDAVIAGTASGMLLDDYVRLRRGA